METIEMNVHIGIGIDDFVEKHYRLALDVANKAKKKYPKQEFEDLLQLALIGLVKAYQGYDPTKFNVKFSTYGVPKMIGEISRYMRDHGSNIRYPREYKQIWKKVVKEGPEFEHEPAEVIAEKIGHSVEKVREAMKYMDKQQTTSLDKELNLGSENDPLTLMDVVLSTSGVYSSVYVSDFIDSLDERDQKILYLSVEKDLPQREVGRIVGISQVQVSRVMKRIGAQLEEYLQVS